MDKKIYLAVIGVLVLLFLGQLTFQLVFKEEGIRGDILWLASDKEAGLAPGKKVPVPRTVTLTTTVPTVTMAKSEGGYTGGYAVVLPPGREIAVTANIVITVDDVGIAASKASSMVSSMGGYVANSNIGKDRGFMSLKVPSDKLSEALNYLRTLGDVENEGISTVDLTENIIDLEARLRNAKAEEQRLLYLLNRTVSVQEILEVESRLSAVREKIERLEAMRKSMERSVDYATINLELRKRGKGAGVNYLDKILEDAYKALIGSVYMVVVGGAFLLIPAIIVGIAYKAITWLRAKKQS